MTHYYFDIVEGEDRTLDDVGLELADKGAARAHAASLLIEIARDFVRCGNLSALSVEVRNEVRTASIPCNAAISPQRSSLARAPSEVEILGVELGQEPQFVPVQYCDAAAAPF